MTVMFSCLAIFANGNIYCLESGRLLSIFVFCPLHGGRWRRSRTTRLIFKQRLILLHLSSIRAMVDELYVQFKLSDRSVQTILGVMLKPYPDSYLTKLVFNCSFPKSGGHTRRLWRLQNCTTVRFRSTLPSPSSSLTFLPTGEGKHLPPLALWERGRG